MAGTAEYGLTPEEVRVLGSLMEKERLTPDVYPMTLNALMNACNQKSSREPVVEYDEAAVVAALDGLRQKGLVRLASGESRVQKYRHLLDETHDFEPAEHAALTVLFLRGPQTPGEIRSRTGRLHEYASIEEVDKTLEALAERALVQKLPRQPGSREARYAHLFSGAVAANEAGAEAPAPPVTPVPSRIDALEGEVAKLRAEVEELKAAFAAFRKQFE